MKQRKLGKRIAAWFMCLAMVLTTVNLPAFMTEVKAASVDPSVTAYATVEQLKTSFGLYGTEAKLGKVNFGNGKTWYIAGAQNDGAELVLMCDPTNPLKSGQAFNSKWEIDQNYNPNMGTYENYTMPENAKVYPNHYGASEIREYLTGLYGEGKVYIFTAAEQALMKDTKVYTKDTKNGDSVYSTSDKLYLAYGDLIDKQYITVGANSTSDLNGGIKIGITDNGPDGSPYTTYIDRGNGWFWLRGATDSYETTALKVDMGNYVSEQGVFIGYPVVPAFNMNLSSVLFASVATAASSDAILSDAMTFRMDGTDKVKSSAVACTGNLYVTKGTDAKEYLYVQGKDGDTDWVYSREITADEIVSAETIKTAKSLSSIDLTKCKIWVEKTVDNVSYANMVTAQGNHDFADGVCVCGYHQGNHDFIDSEGKQLEKCKLCKVNNIAYDGIEVTFTAPSYTGSPVGPTDIVVMNGKNEVTSSNYDISITEQTTVKKDGNYTFTITGKGTNYAGTRTVEWNVQKATATVGSTPTVKTGLRYTGDSQDLINAGTVTGGKFVYSSTKTGTYTEDIPTGTDAKTYSVWYKVAGDDNHADSEPVELNPVIAPKLTTHNYVSGVCSVCDKTKTEAIPKKEATKPVEPKKGDEVKDDKKTGDYEIADATKKEVEYKAPADKNAKTVSIPATIKVGGVKYKVTKVDDKAFKGNKKVTKVTVGSNITTIGKEAFSGATKLKTVTIGKNVTKIGANAFKGCSSLASVTLPSKTNKIGANAFKGCKKLKTLKITSKNLTSKTVAKNAFKGLTKATTIKVPKKKLTAYKKLFKSKGLSSKVKVKGY